MYSKYLESMMEFQKNLFKPWQDMVEDSKPAKGEDPMTLKDYFEWMAKINQAMAKEVYKMPQDYFKDMVDGNLFNKNLFPVLNSDMSPWEGMMSFNKVFMENFKNPMDLFKTWEQNFQAYNKAKEVYDSMKDGSFSPDKLMGAVDSFNESFLNYFKSYVIPTSPEVFKPFMEKALSLGEDNAQNFKKMMNFDFLSAFDYSKKSDDFLANLSELQKSYLDKIKYFNPSLGYNERYQAYLEKSFELGSKYQENLMEHLKKSYDLSKKKIEDLSKEWTASLQDLSKPRTFEDFYKYMTTKMEETWKQALNGEENQKLMDEVKKLGQSFYKQNQKLADEFYKVYANPVVKEDVEDLQANIKKLEAKIKSLTKELEGLKDLKK